MWACQGCVERHLVVVVIRLTELQDEGGGVPAWGRGYASSRHLVVVAQAVNQPAVVKRSKNIRYKLSADSALASS